MPHDDAVPGAGPEPGDASPTRCRVGRPRPHRWSRGRFTWILGAAAFLPWLHALDPTPPGLPMRRASGCPGSMIRGFAFSPDGQTLAISDHLGVVTTRPASRVWEVERSFEARGNAIAFAPIGRQLAIGGRDFDVFLCDLGCKGRERSLGVPVRMVSALRFAPDGRTLAASTHTSREIIIWDLETGRQKQTLIGHRAGVIHVAYSPDGQSLASATGKTEDCSVLIWDLATGRPERRWADMGSAVLAIAYSPDGRLLATSCINERTVRLWDVQTGRLTRQIAGHALATWALAFSPDGRLLATGAGDGMASVWSVATGRELRRLDSQADLLRHVAFSPDGRTLAAAGSDGDIRIWELEELLAADFDS